MSTGIPAVAADVGAHYFHASAAGANGPECVPLGGKNGQPNAIVFDGNGFLIGEEAKHAKRMYPDTYAEGLKHFIGDRNGKPHPVIGGIGDKGMPVQLFAEFLRYIRTCLTEFLGVTVLNIVLSHPDEAPQCFKDDLVSAAKLAGFESVSLIGEAHCVLLYANYRKPIKPGTTVMIVDNGHSTLNSTIAEVVLDNTLRVLSVATSDQYGGGEYTALIREELCQQLKAKGYSVDATSVEQTTSLYDEAEHVKHQLSTKDSATAMVTFTSPPQKITITRARAEALWAPLRKEALKVVARCLKDAKLPKEKIETLILAGGNMAIPSLHDDICKFVGRDAEKLPNPEMAVAFGGTLAAPGLFKDKGVLATGGKGASQHVLPVITKLERVTSRNLAIKLIDRITKDEIMEVLVPKGTPIPHHIERVYSLTDPTSKPGSQAVKITILQPRPGEDTVKTAAALDNFDATGLAPSDKTEGRIHIALDVSADEQTSYKIVDSETKDRTWDRTIDKPTQL